MSAANSLPDDVNTLKAMLRAERAARLAAEAEAQVRTLLIEKLKLTIKKLRHEQFGQSGPLSTSRAFCPFRSVNRDLKRHGTKDRVGIDGTDGELEKTARSICRLARSARPSVSADLLTPRTQTTWPRYLVGAALQRRRTSQLAARLWKRPKCKSPPSLPPSFTQTSLSASTDCL